MGKTLGLWTRKVFRCCKKILIGHTGKILEHCSAKCCGDGGDPAQEVSEGNNIGK